MRIWNFEFRNADFVYTDVRDVLRRRVHRTEDEIRNSQSEI
jgi:hypothetical protein